MVSSLSELELPFLTLLIFYNLPLTTKGDKIETCIDKYEHEGGRLDIGIVNLDNNIARVCDRLRNLDEALTKMYKDPPVDGGEEMMMLSRTYNQACLDLLYFCTMDKLKTLKVASNIIEHGGPKFFDVDIDEKKMEERFKWDEEAMDGMHIVRKKTNEHWYDLWHLYNSLP